MNTKHFEEDTLDLYQNAPFGYFTMGADGLILNINDTLLGWLGYQRDEIVFERSFQDLLGMGEKIYFETHMMPLLQMHGEISEINISLRGKESTVLPSLVNATRVLVQPENKALFRFSVLKITQRKLYEAELLEARKEAERAVNRLVQVNQELERFAHTASHDLQAPLNTIFGLLALLNDQGYFPPDSDGAKYYALIIRNTERMKLIIRDLLDYSKIEEGSKRFEEVPLNEVCSDAMQMIAAEVEQNKAVFKVPELPVVFGDRIQLIRLFQNLFSNSIKYRSKANPVIAIEYEETPEAFTIYIKDNGMGFEQEYADQIFGFMKRLHSHDAISGTGIGLAACRRILEIHGGEIGAKSAPGEGSTFYFTLPKRPVAT